MKFQLTQAIFLPRVALLQFKVCRCEIIGDFKSYTFKESFPNTGCNVYETSGVHSACIDGALRTIATDLS